MRRISAEMIRGLRIAMEVGKGLSMPTTRAKLMAFVFLAGSTVFAQIQPGQLEEGNNFAAATGQSSSTDRQGLSLTQKYQLALKRTFEPGELLRLSASAAWNQKRNYPSEWGQGWDAFGVRMASQVGQQMVREQIEFGVWAFDHEDPRNRRSGLKGVWPRTRFAMVHTFVTRSDSGNTMPAYSRFIGDYSAAFISREWYPDRFHTVGQGLEAGTISLGYDVGMNVLREFWPHHRNGE
jgi:hypothetical protein